MHLIITIIKNTICFHTYALYFYTLADAPNLLTHSNLRVACPFFTHNLHFISTLTVIIY